MPPSGRHLTPRAPRHFAVIGDDVRRWSDTLCTAAEKVAQAFCADAIRRHAVQARAIFYFDFRRHMFVCDHEPVLRLPRLLLILPARVSFRVLLLPLFPRQLAMPSSLILFITILLIAWLFHSGVFPGVIAIAGALATVATANSSPKSVSSLYYGLTPAALTIYMKDARLALEIRCFKCSLT